MKTYPPMGMELTDRIQGLPVKRIFNPGTYTDELKNLSEMLAQLEKSSSLQALAKFEEKYWATVKRMGMLIPSTALVLYATYVRPNPFASLAEHSTWTLIFGGLIGIGAYLAIRSYLRARGAGLLCNYIKNET